MTTDWRAEYPFESRFLPVPDGSGYPLRNVQLHYVDECLCDRSSAPVLLFVHGNPTWSFYWRALISGLRDRFRCVAVDHIGCGLSDKGDSLSEYPFTLNRRIEDLTALIDQLDLQNITIVAHDWGGAISVGAAGRRADRIKQFVLMNTGAFRMEWNKCPRRIQACRIPVFNRIAMKGFNAFSVAAVHMAVEKRLSPSAKAGLLAPYNSWKNRHAVYEFVQDIPFTPRDRSYETLCEVESYLQLFRDYPVLLPWGMKDWCFTPEYLEVFKRRFTHAQAVEMPDVGHYIVEDAPDRVLGAITEFLS